jgi:hypothetical protein
MKNGSVIVDVAIDQGGCFETSRPTTHQQPTFVINGVVHYCVANMPGAVGRTSTIALCNATLPYTVKIANLGYEKAADQDPGLAEGINLVRGRVTNAAVAQAVQMRPDSSKWQWSVQVIDEPEEVNAWCMAGGRMAIYTGLIQKVDPTDDELAQVMGHEIAHALALGFLTCRFSGGLCRGVPASPVSLPRPP